MASSSTAGSLASDIDLAALIRAGDTIAWSGGAAEPLHLLARLNAQMEQVPACRAFIGLSLSETLDAQRMAGRLDVLTLGGAGTNRRFASGGKHQAPGLGPGPGLGSGLGIVPAHYSALPRLVADGHLKFDVVFVQLAPDGAGHRLTLMTDYLAAGIPLARTVIAEINDQAPCVLGDTAVPAADIDHAVHVSRLIGDGATLQVGLGTLPDACLASLNARRDLGLHSGTIGDRAADLVDAGVITNRLKPLDTGLCVTAGLLGTQRLYRWAHRNPLLRLRNAAYTHDTVTHAQIPNLIGINSALEIDLSGQMNAEVAGGQSLGMIGGHGDFMRGCQRSPGGRAILALEATARGAKISRIVPRLADGIVTSSRSDADVVVTEYGIAELRGRSLAERAKALIAIAHPDFRKQLEATLDQLV
jgi:acyl-CoA hydrolase